MNCYDCKYMKIVYHNTLEGKAYCTKYNKYIPTSAMAYNFWCDYESKEDSKISNR